MNEILNLVSSTRYGVRVCYNNHMVAYGKGDQENSTREMICPTNDSGVVALEAAILLLIHSSDHYDQCICCMSRQIFVEEEINRGSSNWKLI